MSNEWLRREKWRTREPRVCFLVVACRRGVYPRSSDHTVLNENAPEETSYCEEKSSAGKSHCEKESGAGTALSIDNAEEKHGER